MHDQKIDINRMVKLLMIILECIRVLNDTIGTIIIIKYITHIEFTLTIRTM